MISFPSVNNFFLYNFLYLCIWLDNKPFVSSVDQISKVIVKEMLRWNYETITSNWCGYFVKAFISALQVSSLRASNWCSLLIHRKCDPKCHQLYNLHLNTWTGGGVYCIIYAWNLLWAFLSMYLLGSFIKAWPWMHAGYWSPWFIFFLENCHLKCKKFVRLIFSSFLCSPGWFVLIQR